jgi:hypothetical protein
MKNVGAASAAEIDAAGMDGIGRPRQGRTASKERRGRSHLLRLERDVRHGAGPVHGGPEQDDPSALGVLQASNELRLHLRDPDVLDQPHQRRLEQR